MCAGVTFNFFTSDWYVKRQAARDGGGMQPEHRLPPMILGGILIPVGLFLYGWTAEARVQWMAPIMGTALVGFGLLVTNVPCFTYLVDAYGVHTASAMAATTVVKCLFGALLPLAAPPLYAKLGMGWGNSVLGLLHCTSCRCRCCFIAMGSRFEPLRNVRLCFDVPTETYNVHERCYKLDSGEHGYETDYLHVCCLHYTGTILGKEHTYLPTYCSSYHAIK